MDQVEPGQARFRQGIGAALVLVLAGCAAEPKAEPAAPAATSGGEAAAAPAPRRRTRVSKPRVRGLPPGHVLFSVEDGDLARDVLPLFASQADVAVRWLGPPRKVSLRLTQPVSWQSAMNLVCRFTRTHLTRDHQGRLELRDGWGGELASDDLDLGGVQVTGGGGGGSGRAPARGSSSATAASSSTSGRGSSQGGGATSTYDNTYGGGVDNPSGRTARKLLEGTTTRRSGGRD